MAHRNDKRYFMRAGGGHASVGRAARLAEGSEKAQERIRLGASGYSIGHTGTERDRHHEVRMAC